MEQQTVFLLRLVLALIITIFATIQDLKSYKIKNELVIFAFATGVMCIILSLLYGGEVKNYVCGIVVGFIVTFILFLIRAIGAGDAKLLTVIGFIVGYKMTMKTILLSLVFGLFMGLFSIVLKRYAKIKENVFDVGEIDITKKISNYHIFHFSPAILMAQIVVFAKVCF